MQWALANCDRPFALTGPCELKTRTQGSTVLARSTGAISDYRFALRYDPRQYQVYYNRGVARFENRDNPDS
jgi:hypothetical protein